MDCCPLGGGMDDRDEVKAREEAFALRMRARQEAEDRRAAEEAERSRQEYLKRTGRTEMKP